MNKPLFQVQHHAAHAYACMIDNNITGSALAVSWDGTGLGSDGSVFGGEFFRVNEDSIERIAHLSYFPLPGGDIAVKQPWRSALGMLWQLFSERIFEVIDKYRLPLKQIRAMPIAVKALAKNVNCPFTSSVGRIFDAVSALALGVEYNRFEGEAAMALEYIADANISDSYHLKLKSATTPNVLDWEELINELLFDVSHSVNQSVIAMKLHNSLINAICKTAQTMNLSKVLLTGGCFLNRILTELTMKKLRELGFTPYIHRRIPPGDGGISAGQIAALKSHKISDTINKPTSEDGYVFSNTR